MSAVMTYTTLLTDVQGYTERPADANLLAQLPRLVMQAEFRIATDLRILGTQQVVTSAFTANQPTLAKPTRWRRSTSLTYTNAAGKQVELYLRTYEFCRQFWPQNGATTATPRFYADYNFDNFLIAGTPNAAFAFELLYVAKLIPLDNVEQVNWLTINAPQLLLAAALLEAEIWLKNQTRIVQRQAAYDSALNALRGEDSTRLADRGVVVGP